MSTLSIEQVNAALISGKFTNAELDTVIQALKFARSQLGRQVKTGLTVGKKVTFTSSRTGQDITGTVHKINRKFIQVSTTQGMWRVPAQMLTVL